MHGQGICVVFTLWHFAFGLRVFYFLAALATQLWHAWACEKRQHDMSSTHIHTRSGRIDRRAVSRGPSHGAACVAD